MQPFHFPLERVLLWYRKQAQLEEVRLAASVLTLNRAQEAVDRLRAERLAVRRSVISTAGISTQELAALASYVRGVNGRESELVLDLQKQELSVQAQRQRVQAARSRVQLLEHLRERRVSEHSYAVDRELESLAADSYMSKWSQQ